MIKLLLVFWLLILLRPSFFVYGTNTPYNDSLEVLLNEHPEQDARRATLLIQLANSLFHFDTERSYQLTAEASELSETLKYDLGKAQSNWLFGQYYGYQEDFEQAIHYYEKAVGLFRKVGDQSGLAVSSNNLGAIYQLKGYYQQALENYFKTLRLYEEMDEMEGVATAYNNIGLIYHYLSDQPRAVDYYQRSLELSYMLNDDRGKALIYNNLGTVYQENEDYATAKANYLKSLELYQELNDKLGILLGNLNLGTVHFAMGDFEHAQELLYTGLEMSIQLGSRSYEGWYYLGLAQLFKEKDQPDKLYAYSLKAFEAGKEISEAELMYESAWLLSVVYAEKGEYRQAYEYHVKYQLLNDSLVDIDNIRRGIGQEFEYLHERELELARNEQNMRDAILQAEIKRQTAIRNTVIIAFLIVVVLLIVIIRSYRLNKRANVELKHQKNEIEEKKTILEEQNRIIKQSKDKFDAILAAIPDLMFVQNSEGIFLDYFSTRNELLLVSPDEIIGKSMHDVFPRHTVEDILKAFQKSRENKSVEPMEYSVDLPLGEKFFEARIVYFEDDKYLSIVRDISDRKLAEKEQEVQEELRKRVLLAEESLRFKQNFLANMSHEIRTPLSGILGMAEILTSTRLNEQQTDYVSTILQSGENLREIINMVLDYSKIEAGKLNLNIQPFRLVNIPGNAEKLFRSICKKPIFFNQTIDPELPLFIEADELRITQVVNNIISNAVKFTEKGSIGFFAELINRNTDSGHIEIKISISDTGKGIAEEAIDKLFQPFSQIEDIDTRHFEGTGLGLAICKEIVELHGGRIGVESKLEQGSRFWFTFMATEALNEPKEQSAKINLPAEKKENLRILLVEDKKVNQKVITLILNTLGHQITVADHGLKALQLFKPDNFDLVLMDIQMPVMDGITATKKLREKYSTLPPIIGLSANAFEGDREKYMKQGLDEYLTKPLNKEEFVKVMGKFFVDS